MFKHLKIVTRLEKRYPDFGGLNLSWETLEGILNIMAQLKIIKKISNWFFYKRFYFKL